MREPSKHKGTGIRERRVVIMNALSLKPAPRRIARESIKRHPEVQQGWNLSMGRGRSIMRSDLDYRHDQSGGLGIYTSCLCQLDFLLGLDLDFTQKRRGRDECTFRRNPKT